MNTLLSIRTNILYSKKQNKQEDDSDDFAKYNELIFLVDKPKYTRTNGGEIIRERAVEELRFTVSEIAFESLIENLIKLKDINEEDLS